MSNPTLPANPAAAGIPITRVLRLDLGSATLLLVVGCTAALMFIARGTTGAVGLAFAPDALGNVADVLTPLVLVSLFLERAVEVVVSGWRDHGARQLRLAVKHAEPGSRIFAERQMHAYRMQTMRLAYIVSFSLAFFAALVGMRAVAPLLDLGSSEMAPLQPLWFARFDILITALLLGGGADGIHKIISTFTDFLDKTRGNLQTTSSDTGTAAGAATVTLPASAAQG